MNAPNESGPNASRDLLDKLAGRARATILWERAWPPLVALLIVVGAFLTVSWLGFWISTPRWGRALGLGAFALALLWPACLFFKIRLPGRGESLARVDRDSGLPHRPASTLDDVLANPASDPTTRAVWNLHLRRITQSARNLRVGAPRPRVALQDRFAVRAGVLVACLAAAFVAGPRKYPLVASAFDFRSAGAATAGYRLDAWIDPPPYTGRPPVLLRRSGDAQSHGERQRVEAPVGSTVIVRMSDGAGVRMETTGALVEPESLEKPGDAPRPTTTRDPADQEKRWTLKGDGALTLQRLGATVASFDLVAVPDRPPTIALREEMRANTRGALTLSYKTSDDYGVVRADAEFTQPRVAGRAGGRSLVEPPRAPLGLPPGAGGSGDAETTTDVSEHPWAGARVTLTLTAQDEAGNVGRSEAVDVVLPQRQFVKPLARAIIEQRRFLALFPDERSRVATAIDALSIEPERFGTGAGPYLGLRTIYARLSTARTDETLREVLAFMWEMALRLEEGDLSEAERDLRAAQQALREALERGASDEELRRLMDQLRAAMDKFLQEFADRQRQQENDQDAQQSAPDPNERTITSQDLNRMLDRMQEMAQSGNTADAQRMLDQLQNMLENLRTARRSQNQMSREMNRSLNQLDQMMRDQQELRDRTFRQSQRNRGQQQGQRQPGQRGQQGEQGGEPGDEQGDEQSQSPQALRERQEALRRQLEDMQRRMRQFGLKPEQGFEDAEGAMRDAEQQLGQGEQGQGPAADAQGRALEGLRRGSQSMAQQMQQQGDQPGQQAGEGPPNGPGQQGRNSADADPLGRESRDRGDNSRSVYDPAGVPAAQRAQRVLEELRRRLSDPSRARDELDYLERLLRRY